MPFAITRRFREFSLGFSSLQDAIDSAVAQGASATNPKVIRVPGGKWTGNVALKAGVNLVGALGGFDAAPEIVGAVSYSPTTGDATSNLASICGFKITAGSGVVGLTHAGSAASIFRVADIRIAKAGTGEEALKVGLDGSTTYLRSVDIVKSSTTGRGIYHSAGTVHCERVTVNQGDSFFYSDQASAFKFGEHFFNRCKYGTGSGLATAPTPNTAAIHITGDSSNYYTFRECDFRVNGNGKHNFYIVGTNYVENMGGFLLNNGHATSFIASGTSGGTYYSQNVAMSGNKTTSTVTLGSFSDGLNLSSTQLMITGGAKIGGTAGWLVNAVDNKNSIGRCPTAQTASKLVIPISGLKVGQTITGFHLVGQIESGGNTVTLDADLRKQTAAAADLTDASVGTMTQLSVTGDTIISSSNTTKSALSDVVGANESFYLVLTCTTGVSCDIDLQGVVILITEP